VLSNERIAAIIALHRFLVCDPPNNRAATQSYPSAPWCHRNAHLHSEAQPCANETARLQLLTRPYEDHHPRRNNKTPVSQDFLHSLHTYHRLHPTSLDWSRHLMKVRNQRRSHHALQHSSKVVIFTQFGHSPSSIPRLTSCCTLTAFYNSNRTSAQKIKKIAWLGVAISYVASGKTGSEDDDKI
jgi:hypothetical protein